jgi:hypothetical protein
VLQLSHFLSFKNNFSDVISLNFDSIKTFYFPLNPSLNLAWHFRVNLILCNSCTIVIITSFTNSSSGISIIYSCLSLNFPARHDGHWVSEASRNGPTRTVSTGKNLCVSHIRNLRGSVQHYGFIIYGK